MFHGYIPASLSSLKSLQELDPSHDKFSSPIPTCLSKFPLMYLNSSYNYFEGEVPAQGVFINTSAISLVGNHKFAETFLRYIYLDVQGKKLPKQRYLSSSSWLYLVLVY